MKTPVEEIIEGILAQTDPVRRGEVGRRLIACRFTSHEDPMINMLALVSALSVQSVRHETEDGNEVVTKEDLKRQGDLIINEIWSLRNPHLILLLLLLLGAFGIGITLGVFVSRLAEPERIETAQ